MARKRVAVDLARAPNMLRSILAETLAAIPDADIVGMDDSAPDMAFDAVLICADQPSLTVLERKQTDRLVVISPSGQRVTIHRPGCAPQVLSDVSPAGIRELLTSPLPRTSWLRDRLTRPFRRRRDQHPQKATPAVAQRDPLSATLSRLVGRILKQRGDRVATVGPGAELRALVDALPMLARGTAEPLPGLQRLVTVFDLSAAESDFLLLASLVEVDSRAARMVALLNDHMGKPRPTLGLVTDLGMASSDIPLRLGPEGAMRRFGLIALAADGPLSAREASVPPDVWPLVLGQKRSPPFPLHQVGHDLLATVPAPEEFKARLKGFAAELADADGSAPAVAVLGSADSGRRAIADALAAWLRPTVLHAAAEALTETGGSAALVREAQLNNAAVIVTDPEGLHADKWPALLSDLDAPLFLIARPDQYGGLALASERPLLKIVVPERDLEQRLRLWRAEAAQLWPDDSLRYVAERFDYGGRSIARASKIAVTQATAEGREQPTPEDLLSACDRLRQTRFDGAAERLPCPFAVDDIVLAADTRTELDLAVAWAQYGQTLFGPGGAGASLRSGGGLACLFSGPPGTGKTMAAQIVARQVDYALYRIDLSKVVDKFIGESEKRLAAVFDEAERSRVALFFDEADALFGKRTEVRDSHDRFANITIDYLLQRLDDFDGLAILATNLAGNIDDAFLRRVRIRAEFAAPGPAERRLIWEKLLPPASACINDIDIAHLANPFELVGGEIRNAIYTAHLLSAQEKTPLAMRHCVRGLWRELAKIGRMADRKQLGPWQSALETDPIAATPAHNDDDAAGAMRGRPATTG